jgi:hypothetical protein
MDPAALRRSIIPTYVYINLRLYGNLGQRSQKTVWEPLSLRLTQILLLLDSNWLVRDRIPQVFY